VSDYFLKYEGSTLLISDTWVLSTNMEDIIQMFSCLLKHDFKVHFIKQSVIMTQQSSPMLVLGFMDQLRQTMQNESTKLIGRTKGSKSSSKFDQYINEILAFIKENKSVSEMARLLDVSRSSLKDYIESRELKEITVGTLFQEVSAHTEEQVIRTIRCPKELNKGDTTE